MKHVTRIVLAAAGRMGGASLLLSGLAIGAFLLPGAAEALQFDRTAIADGQFWRLFTGHFTHWSADHLIWDTLVFAALACVYERRDRRGMGLTLIGSAIAISAGVWQFDPRLEIYRGLSGIDSALFVGLMCNLARGGGRSAKVAGGMIGLFAVKLLVEISSGEALFVNAAGFVPVPSAHMVGGLAGAFWALAGGAGVRGADPLKSATEINDIKTYYKYS